MTVIFLLAENSNKMGIRQSKRSVDISSSPKKDAAPITEKQVNDSAATVENAGDELNKSAKEEVIQTETKVYYVTFVECFHC